MKYPPLTALLALCACPVKAVYTSQGIAVSTGTAIRSQCIADAPAVEYVARLIEEEARRLDLMAPEFSWARTLVCIAPTATLDCGMPYPVYGCTHVSGIVMVSRGITHADWRALLAEEMLKRAVVGMRLNIPFSDEETLLGDARYAKLLAAVIARIDAPNR